MKKRNGFIVAILTISLIFSNFSCLSSTILAQTPLPQPEGKISPFIVNEIESMRTQTEKYFLMSDGSYTVASYASPVHYQDASGSWHEIDNSLLVQDEEIVTKDAPVETVLTEQLTENGTVSLQADKYKITWGYLDANQSTAEIETQQQMSDTGDEAFLKQENLLSRVRYADAFSHVDLQYIISSLGVKDNIILKSRQAKNVYQIRYQYDGLSAVLSDSRLIELKDVDNQTVYRITAPVMTDADGNSSEALCFNILKNTSTELIFELSADIEWLQTAEYPVIIDPLTELVPETELITTATINETNDYMNTGILSGVYNTSLGEEENIGVLKVNTIPGINAWNYIKDATLYMSFSSFGGSISAYHVNYDANLQDLTWETLSEKMESDPMDYYIDKPWYTGTADLDVTRSVQNFVNTGIGVIAIKSDNGSLFIADVGSDMPKITVNYGAQTGVSGRYSYTNFDAGRAGVAYVNDLTGQLFIHREDFGYSANTISASVGMNFVNQGDGLRWRNQYEETITRSGASGAYTYVLEKSDGTILSFITAKEDDDGNTYYTDTEKQGYTYYPSENKMQRDNGDVHLYSGSGDTKYLSKITNQSYETEDGYSNAVEIAYNTDYSHIETVTDGDGKIYKYNYNALSALTSVDYYGENGLSGDVIDSVSYSYSNDNLISVNYHNETSTYQYDQQTGQFEKMSAPDGYGFAFEIDSVRNKIKSVTEYGGNVQGDQIIMTREPGRTIYTDLNDQQKIFIFDQSGKPVTIMDEDGYTVHQKYTEAGTLSGTTDVSVPIVNLITNNSFEDGLNTFGRFGTASQSSEKAYNGKHAAKLTHTAAREGEPTSVRHALTGLEADVYSFSAYVLAESLQNGGYAALRVFYFDENNNESDPIYSEKITAASEDWERLVVTITLPEDANALIAEAIVGGTAGTVYYDALQLEKHKTSYAYNPVSNSDFQKGETDWILTDNAEIVTDNAVRGGLDEHVLRIKGTGLDSEEQAKQIVLLNQQQSTQITFSAWLKTQGAMRDGAHVWGNNAAARICFYLGTLSNSGDLTVQTSYLYEVNPFVCGNWYRVSDAFDVDAAYDAVMISVEFREQSGVLYVDGFEIGTTDFGGSVNISEQAETQTQTESGSTGSEDVQSDSSQQEEDVVYDDEGRVLSVTQGDVTRSYAYNADDQTTMEKTTIGAMSLTNYYDYASSNGQNSVTQTDPLGHSSTTVKDAVFDQVVRKVYQDGTEAGYVYNALRQLANLENESADKSSGTHVTYVYEHERISQIMLSENHLTYTFDYNPFGGVTSISVEDQPLVTYTYVSSIRRVPSCITFGNGQTLNYTYTDDWQVQAVYLGQQKIMEYEYAETGKQLCERDYLNGQSRTVDEKGTRVWNLDKTQLLYTCTDIGEELDETVGTFAYQTIKKELENEKSVSFGSLTKITSYDAFERISAVTIKNGEHVLLTQTYSYISPSAGETSELVSMITTTAGNNSSITAYTYNAMNSLASITVDGNLIKTYTYTNDDQLSSEIDSLNNKRYCYSYDKYGNITQKKEQDISIINGYITVDAEQTTNYTYDGEWQDQLATVGGKTITYDGSGNMTGYDGATFTWSAGRRLASFAKGNTNAFYLYDINGLRTSKTVGQTVYTYTWLEDMPVHLQKGNTNMHFYYDGDGKVTGMSYSGTDYFYDRNLMGDVVRILTSAGEPVVIYQYDAWGNILSKSGSMANTLGTDNPFRYRGYMYDEESGLYYLQSRYYDPRLGRYISPDNTEVLFGQTNLTTMYNLYAYCCNNPIAAIDPNGYWTIYHGVYAVADSKYDTLESLAEEITGRPQDWIGIHRKSSGNVRAGERVNIENLMWWEYIRTINSRCNSKNGNAYSVVFDGHDFNITLRMLFHYRKDGLLESDGLAKFTENSSTNTNENTSLLMQQTAREIQIAWTLGYNEDPTAPLDGIYNNVMGQYPVRVNIDFILKYELHTTAQLKSNSYSSLDRSGFINLYYQVENKQPQAVVLQNAQNPEGAYHNSYNVTLTGPKLIDLPYLMRHEIGHCFGLADGCDHNHKKDEDKDEDEDKKYFCSVERYGISKTHIMYGDGYVEPQHISMIIYALYENKMQYFDDTRGACHDENDKEPGHPVSKALTIYHTNAYQGMHTTHISRY